MKNIPYKNFESFILRAPLLPFNFLDSLLSGTSSREEQLKKICQSPIIQEAIFLGSPDLHARLLLWIDNKLTDKKKAESLQYAIMRYILRMCTRCTPFGLFAGFTIGQIDDVTHIELSELSEYKRHTRLDMNYLCALAQNLAKNPLIKDKINYYPNSSIYPVGDQLRYVEYRYNGSKRTHHIVEVENSKYLQYILKSASSGLGFDQLVNCLVDDEITREESGDFINELIDSQVLVNDLEPAITGPEFIDQIIEVLNPIDGIEGIKNILLSIKEDLKEIDSSKIGTTVSKYHKISENIKPLKTDYEMKFLFQTDMVLPAASYTLEKDIVDEVKGGFDLLNKFSSKNKSNLTLFRDAFFERYETRELPLLLVLDTEVGIGYLQNNQGGDIAPLLDGLVLPYSGGGGQEIKWGETQSFLFKKYKEALTENTHEVEITDKEIEGFKSDWDDLPDTFSAMIKVLKEKENSGQKKIIFSGFGGSSAGNLLGRFCFADKDTHDYVKEITEKEKELNKDVILAEIIHLPESRMGNILLRPVLRQYEIPYLAKSAVPSEDQIKMEDLMISVKNNKIILRSKVLNKEIKPRLSSAHNFSNNALPVYQFLADLQTQNLRGGLGFHWGHLANESDFLPRVIYKNLILSLATWDVKQKDVKEFSEIKNDDKLVETIEKWRKERKIPPYVTLVDSDNKLFINLDNSLSIRTLFSITKKRPSFKLEEFLFDPENGLVKGKDGSFTNEIVLSFYKDTAAVILKRK